MNQAIYLLIQKVDQRLKLMEKGLTYATSRIDELIEHKFYFEAFMIHCQLIEHGLKFYFRYMDIYEDALVILGKEKPYKLKLGNLEGQTMGYLIKEFKRINGDSLLVKDLWDLNNFRKRAIHQIFEGEEDFSEFEKEIEEYLKSDIKSLIRSVIEQKINIQKEIAKFVEGDIN